MKPHVPIPHNKELLFGTSGSSGNDYILTLELCDKVTGERVSAILNSDIVEDKCDDIYMIKPHLYNYAMNEIDISSENDIKYSWLNIIEDEDTPLLNRIGNIPEGARIV